MYVRMYGSTNVDRVTRNWVNKMNKDMKADLICAHISDFDDVMAELELN